MPQPASRNLWRPQLIRLNVGGTISAGDFSGGTNYRLSDHNREAVQESNEKIENSQRMANGLMRKYVIANKRSWSVSWSMLPSLAIHTIDGYLGAMDLKDFYTNNYDNSFLLGFYTGTTAAVTQPKGTLPAPTTITTVYISDFSATINKRLGDIDYWDCSITFVEA